MAKTLILILILLILCSCSKKEKETEFSEPYKLSRKTKDIINNLIEYGEITGKAIGYSGKTSKQWSNFIDLKENTNNQDLRMLTLHSNSVVKCYAYDILIENNDKNKFSILKTNLKDSNFVTTQYGCSENKIRVNDYLIESFLKGNKKNTTKSDKKILDSLIIFTPDLICDYKKYLLEYIAPKQGYYNRIKELAAKGNQYSIIALSKYQKESDIDLINKLLLNKDSKTQKKGLLALKNFPNNSSFKIIKKIHSEEIIRQKKAYYSILNELYESIVSYKDKKSRNLLEKTITKSNPSLRKKHFECIWLALKKNPNPIYNGIIKQLNYTKKEIKNLENKWKPYL